MALNALRFFATVPNWLRATESPGYAPGRRGFLLLMLVGLWGAQPPRLAAQGLVLNEFMAANASVVADEDGDFPDWIEVYNAGDQAVQLAGFGLSDDPANPLKWTFPAYLLPAKGFLLVFASDKNRPSGPYLHTNFKLSASGEPLQLSNATGAPVDALPAVSLATNAAYGRQPDGSSSFVFFASNPTPGASNPAAGNRGLLMAPVFAPVGGFYTGPVTLGLSTNHADAVIRYTLDGSEPTELSPAYSAPLLVQSRTGIPNELSIIPTNRVLVGPSTYYPPGGEVFKAGIVRARAYRPGSPPSEVVTNSYFVDPNIHERYQLPVVSVATDRENLFGGKTGIYVPGDEFNGDHDRSGNYFQRGDAWERPAHVQFFDVDRSRGFSQRMGVRIHGSASRVDPQKSLRLYADEQYGPPAIRYPIFPDKPLTEFKRLLLRNGGNDRSFSTLRDVFIQGLVRDLDLDAQASRPVLVFLNGEYWGIHHAQERLDPHYLAGNHGVDEGVDFLEMDRNVVEGDAAHYQRMIDFIGSGDMRVPANFDTVAKWMDVDEFIHYQAAQIYAA
ncbi:MAG: CotH kinase family protein, partial [Ferruginibacter sp.]|nr:CotH kinase family protein [Cytophagales bacterium]